MANDGTYSWKPEKQPAKPTDWKKVGRIVLTVEKLLQILEICNFPIERFFSASIVDYDVNKELQALIEELPSDKKKNIIAFIKQ